MGDRYEVILADPPWQEAGGGKIKRGADRHYDLMRTDDIVALAPRVRALAADDAYLFLWVTDAFLPDGLRVMSAWGFDYKRTFVWCKDSFGLGFYARGQHEICLFGVRGRPARSRRVKGNWGTDIPSVLHAPKRRHSQKPDAFYEIVESFGDSFCELFARSRRVGWHSVGKELGVTL